MLLSLGKTVKTHLHHRGYSNVVSLSCPFLSMLFDTFFEQHCELHWLRRHDSRRRVEKLFEKVLPMPLSVVWNLLAKLGMSESEAAFARK